MASAEQMRKRQAVLADFGEFALGCEDLDSVLTEACRLIGGALGTHRAKILEIEDGGKTLLVRSGVGWAPDVVGQVRMPMSEHTSETYSIEQARPVVTRDVRTEKRFEIPEFMKKAGVVALANVPILLPGKSAYGVLQVDATDPRDFGDDEVQFLRTYSAILGPVIDRLLKLQELQSGEERFHLIVENARDYAIFFTDAEARITHWFPGAEAVFGWTAEEAVGQSVAMLFTPEDRDSGADQMEFEKARKEGVSADVRWHQGKGGKRVFIEGSVTALRRSDGTLYSFLKIGQDLTSRRINEERLRVMVAELQHRTRNVLGVVQSIAHQTLATSDTLETFGAQFGERLAALARVQDLLSRSDQEPITIGDLVRLELEALGGDAIFDRVTVKGPEARIRKSNMQILALAIHELAINARKHGALSKDGGKLSVVWRTYRNRGEERRIVLDWVEEGISIGPAFGKKRRGYGRELIERALPYALGTPTKYELSEGRLHCSIEVELKNPVDWDIVT